MTNSNEHKTISPEFKQLLHDIISDISALISEYLGVSAYDEGKIKAIVDGTFEPNTEKHSGIMTIGTKYSRQGCCRQTIPGGCILSKSGTI